MLKFRLFVVAAIAVLSIFCMSYTQLAAADKFDDLKNRFLPPYLRNKELTVEDVAKAFRDKCRKASGTWNSTLYRDVEQGAANFVSCISTLANLTALKEEIEIARPIGELDTVFSKHCQKAPMAEKCLREFNKVIQPCLSKAEKHQNAISLRIATGLLGFMCARGGDQIAVFVAEDGPECLEANQEAITQCANQSFSEFKPRQRITDVFYLPDFTLEPEHCVDLATFEACTLHHLARCREITPVNVAESVFKYIKIETSCKDYLEGKTKPKSVLKDPNETDAAAVMQWSIPMALLGVLVASKARHFV